MQIKTDQLYVHIYICIGLSFSVAKYWNGKAVMLEKTYNTGGCSESSVSTLVPQPKQLM